VGEAQATLVVATVAYIGLAAYTVFGLGIIVGDAWSRVGNAFYVLFSRDPHLAAVGFVWNPLPSLVMLPFLPFQAIWPELVTHGFLASLVSAIFMAASVWQVRGILSDLGVVWPLRIVLTMLFAVQPMILLYAANGTSEAMFLFFLLVSARHLMRWLDSRSTTALALSGLGLALAYWTRYEAVAAALATVSLVAAWSFIRTPGPREERRLTALADSIVVGLPFAAAFGLWALASWMIVGSPFETFTSIYGNSSQVSLAAGWLRESTGQGTDSAGRYVLDQLNGLAPQAIVLMGLAGFFALWRRDPRVLAIVAVMGGVVMFAAWAFLTERSFGWLRFYIAVIPLVVLLGGLVLSTKRVGRFPVATDRVPAWTRSVSGFASRVTIAALVILLSVVGIGESVRTMLDAHLGREEAYTVQSWLVGPDGQSPLPDQTHAAGGAVARYLDRLPPEDGSVLVDVATGFPVVLQSTRPRQFVITPDRDFPASLADPRAFGISYLLVRADSELDAVGRVHGLATATQSSVADLVKEFTEGAVTWRLFAVRDPIIEAAADETSAGVPPDNIEG
jgi:hypothetical protein